MNKSGELSSLVIGVSSLVIGVTAGIGLILAHVFGTPTVRYWATGIMLSLQGLAVPWLLWCMVAKKADDTPRSAPADQTPPVISPRTLREAALYEELNAEREAETLASLRQDNAELRHTVGVLQDNLEKITAWPEEFTPEERKQAHSWRRRALQSEKQMEVLRQRLVVLNEEIVELRGAP